MDATWTNSISLFSHLQTEVLKPASWDYCRDEMLRQIKWATQTTGTPSTVSDVTAAELPVLAHPSPFPGSMVLTLDQLSLDIAQLCPTLTDNAWSLGPHNSWVTSSRACVVGMSTSPEISECGGGCCWLCWQVPVKYFVFLRQASSTSSYI